MTQKIFDTDNEEDMKLLWSILPTNTFKIRGMNGQATYLFEDDNKCYASICEDIIRINWHNKTEITRPINYEDMIGCVGWFNDTGIVNTKTDRLSILVSYKKDNEYYFKDVFDGTWKSFTPAKKSELKFYGD